MRKNIAHALIFALSVAAPGLATLGLATLALAPAAQAADLSAYDCSRVGDGSTTLSNRHVVQVIEGRLQEWDEYLSREDAPHLVCIVQTRPTSQSLDSAAAQDLLAAGTRVTAAMVASSARTLESAASNTSVRSNDGKFHDGTARKLPGVSHSTTSVATQQSAVFDAAAMTPASRRYGDSATVQTESTTSAADTSSSTTDEPALTVGVDDRVRISTATSSTYPYNTIGYLSIQFPSGNRYRCTGFLVSAYVVLTAGHCVHDRNEGGYITSATFYPGQNEASFTSPTLRPYGSNSDLKWTRTTDKWTQISGSDSYPTSSYQYDLAALEFNTPFTHTSTFMPVVFNDTTSTANTAGYPATVSSTTSEGLWSTSGAETNTSVSSLRAQGLKAYKIDASGGQSGSPFWSFDSATGRRQLMGSLSYGDDLDDNAGGPWYSTSNQTLVSGWIGWTPASDAVSTSNSTTGLRVPGIYDSSQTAIQSFLRFYNTGSTAGTVDVTLATPDDGVLLATWTSPSIVPNASLQVDIPTIEAGAVGGSIVKRGFYVASIRSHFNGYFQHAIWRPSAGILTDVTACDTRVTADPTKLMNVHTSTLNSGYPASVLIHNTSASQASVNLGIYDAKTGTKLGTYTTGFIPANAEVIRPVTTIEQGSGVTPTATQYHYNIKVESTFTGTLQNLVTNGGIGSVVTDMTPVCTLTGS